MNHFQCDHCQEWVPIDKAMAVQNRNHCPKCLWSKHVDDAPGDRKANCYGLMQPIGLTMKQTRNKYAKTPGELMLIHDCQECGKININRIAADDDTDAILDIFASSITLDPEKKRNLRSQHITPLSKRRKKEILIQLFGKT